VKRTAVVLVVMVSLVAAASASPLPPNAGVVFVNGAPLYDEQPGRTLKASEYLTLGDVVTMLNRNGSFKDNGKDRDFTRIKAMDGKEGWVRKDYVAGKSSIGIVKSDKATIYSEPRDIKITSRFVSGMTLVAILQDGTTGGFAKVQGYDTAQGILFTDSTFLSMDDLATADADVQAAILYDVAMATKDPGVRKNLLKLAAAHYGSSIFSPKVQAALGTAAGSGGQGN